MIETNLEKTQKIHGNIIASTKIEGGKYQKNQEKTYELNGLERFGGIYSKLNNFYLGKCNKNDLKDELELMIIIANRMLKIPLVLMNYIKDLDEITGSYHWDEKIRPNVEEKKKEKEITDLLDYAIFLILSLKSI